MKRVILLALLSMQLTRTGAQETACFIQAKNEMTEMLEGKQPLSFERAVFLMENAYYDNRFDYGDFKKKINYCANEVSLIATLAYNAKAIAGAQTFTDTPEKQEEKYDRALNNYGIFKFITDTTYQVLLADSSRELFLIERHLPFAYPVIDPFGSNDWKNTQVLNLALNKTGNCFALSALFKILADRLNTGATLCTAPGHMYIRHADENGTLFNVELATASFPGTGSLKTLTYTTTQGIKSGIALRQLNDKQAVALCLVYLAKGYQHKFNKTPDNFMLHCAEAALRHDSLNLNALLLKAEVMEYKLAATGQKVETLRKSADFRAYEELINRLYTLGYREMPTEMKNMIISSLTQDSLPLRVQNHTPVAFKGMKKPTRYASLSWGIFEEVHTHKPVEQYGRTVFDTKTQKIKVFEKADTLYNNYNFDPVVFAWNIDPLAAKYAGISPYAAFKNSPLVFNDPDGKDAKVTINRNETGGGKITISTTVYVKNGTTDLINQYNNWVTDLNKTGCYSDDQGNDWNVELDIKYEILDPTISIQSGDNTMALNYNGSRSHGQGYLEGTGRIVNGEKIIDEYSASTPNNANIVSGKENSKHTIIHETLHMMGLNDRYSKGSKEMIDPSGEQYFIPNQDVGDKTYEGDIMNDGSRISQAHFDNFARTLSKINQTMFTLKYMVDINNKNGSTIGSNSGGLSDQEKKTETSVPSF